MPASSASTDFSLSICTGRPTMTHDDRVRHSWQKYDDRTASQSRPPMGRQFINCTSFILLFFPSSLSHSLSLSLPRFDRVLLRRPIRRSCDTSTGTSASGMAQFAPLRSRAENLHHLLLLISLLVSPRRSFTMYVGRDETVPRAGPHRGLTPRSIIRDGPSAFNYGICYT